MRMLSLIACAGIMLSAGCASTGRTVEIDRRGGADPQQPRIMAYRVAHEAADHLALEVQYYYGGGKGECVRLGAITKQDGDSTGSWSYRPAALDEGKHWAQILIGIADDAPRIYKSDALEFMMYICGGGKFQQATVPLKKTWRRLKDRRPCHDDWGAGCVSPESGKDRVQDQKDLEKR